VERWAWSICCFSRLREVSY